MAALVGLATASGETRLGDADSAAAVGLALGGGIGLMLWATCRFVASELAKRELRGERLFDEFRRYYHRRIREQWQVLLEGRERLPAPFKGYGRIARPWDGGGSLRHRSHLAGAIRAARTDDGGPRLLVVGPAGYGKTVALLDIAQHLERENGDGYGVPVVFNLGSWRHDDDDLARLVGVVAGAA
jgi:hypothetical protein